jgi:hypothetical protein
MADTGVGIKGQVYNGDVVGIYNRVIRFSEEMWKCASSSVPYLSTADQARLGKYLDAIDAYNAWVQAQPELDLPETAPKSYVLDTPPATAEVESDDLNDVIRMMTDMKDELINSQSARMPCRLVSFDAVRLTDYVSKIRKFLTDYIQKVQPLDLPESSPRDAVSGTGKVGV